MFKDLKDSLLSFKLKYCILFMLGYEIFRSTVLDRKFYGQYTVFTVVNFFSTKFGVHIEKMKEDTYYLLAMLIYVVVIYLIYIIFKLVLFSIRNRRIFYENR